MYVWLCSDGTVPPVAHAVKLCLIAWFVGKGATDLELEIMAADTTFLCVLAKSHDQCLLSVPYIHQNPVEIFEKGVGMPKMVQFVEVGLCVVYDL